MGTKYTIEVEDKPFELISEDGFTSEKLYRVKGFNSLVFDWNGLNMLTPYTEPDMEQVRKEAYEQGAEDMRKALRLLIDCDDDCLTIHDIFKAFREGSYHAVVRKHPAMEIIEKIRQYEQEEKITKGDVVRIKSAPEVEILATCADESHVSGIALTEVDGCCEIGDQYTDIVIHKVEKTGRHYEIAEVLRKMKES